MTPDALRLLDDRLPVDPPDMAGMWRRGRRARKQRRAISIATGAATLLVLVGTAGFVIINSAPRKDKGIAPTSSSGVASAIAPGASETCGVLVDGTRFTLVAAAALSSADIAGMSGVIVIPDAQFGVRAVGEQTITRAQVADSAQKADGVLTFQACDWILTIQLHDFARSMRDQLKRSVKPSCYQGFPVFLPSRPFRFGTSSELPNDISVDLGAVRGAAVREISIPAGD